MQASNKNEIKKIHFQEARKQPPVLPIPLADHHDQGSTDIFCTNFFFALFSSFITCSCRIRREPNQLAMSDRRANGDDGRYQTSLHDYDDEWHGGIVLVRSRRPPSLSFLGAFYVHGIMAINLNEGLCVSPGFAQRNRKIYPKVSSSVVESFVFCFYNFINFNHVWCHVTTVFVKCDLWCGRW